MINHYRTALLNISGDNWPGLEYPGEELVDTLFASRPLPSHVRVVRGLIFGENPDRAYLNYRLKQITTLWHDSILNEAATDVDSRITYWPLKFSSDMSSFGTLKVDSINGSVIPDYSYNPTPYADDRNGRAEFIYELNVTGDSAIVVDEFTKKTRTISKTGNYFDLGYNARLTIGNGSWRVVIFGRPQKDLGQILVDCDLIRNSDVELLLFQGKSSLKELWKTSEFLPERLGALSLALAIEISGIPVIKTI
jgi:hypothetical protein